MPAPPHDQFQGFDLFNIGLAPPDITFWEQNILSPPSAFQYGNTFNRSESPPFPTSDTSYGNGYGDVTSPEPVPNWQVLGMSLDIPREIERTNPHVSLIRSHAYAYGFGEETSELVRDLFPDLQNSYTF
jgi:hypothetical protein